MLYGLYNFLMPKRYLYNFDQTLAEEVLYDIDALIKQINELRQRKLDYILRVPKCTTSLFIATSTNTKRMVTTRIFLS